MNSFTLISSVILYVLAFICFVLPYYNGQKNTGKFVGSILAVIITLTLIGNLDSIEFFIWPLIAVFQILFITLWTFRKFGKQKAGKITVTILTSAFLLILLHPWIADWTYSKNDVRKVLLFHKMELHDDFKILENESGGFRDYYETFTIKLSDNDFNNIAQKIKISKNFKGYFTDYTNLPSANFENYDTVDFESGNFFEREYFSKQTMSNGTYHFRFQLDKKDKKLSYTGSDE